MQRLGDHVVHKSARRAQEPEPPRREQPHPPHLAFANEQPRALAGHRLENERPTADDERMIRLEDRNGIAENDPPDGPRV
jgi:hypothetical protein